ncbi:Uncharacterised protein [Salmonella enterica subsp. enterica]|uniref:Secreted protein n=1 Tax=Salmonella enterica I TaxID=59201 RepID=A0A379WX20_SALET|nr:Uncharacterised protein [Salmonella enterica subsp. enterica]
MKMTKLTTLLLTATLGLASGAALAAESNAQSSNGQAELGGKCRSGCPDAARMWRRMM